MRTSKNSNDWNHSYAYNSSNQISVIKHYSSNTSKDTDTYNYTWENDKLAKFSKLSYNGRTDVFDYTYSGKTCKGWCFNFYGDAIEDVIFIAHPELVGIRTTQLPDQSYSKDTEKSEYYDEYFKETCKNETIFENTIKYTYKLNSDGYLESVKIEETDVQTYTRSFEDKNGDGVISDDERNVSGKHVDAYTSTLIFKWE